MFWRTLLRTKTSVKPFNTFRLNRRRPSDTGGGTEQGLSGPSSGSESRTPSWRTQAAKNRKQEDLVSEPAECEQNIRSTQALDSRVQGPGSGVQLNSHRTLEVLSLGHLCQGQFGNLSLRMDEDWNEGLSSSRVVSCPSQSKHILPPPSASFNWRPDGGQVINTALFTSSSSSCMETYTKPGQEVSSVQLLFVTTSTLSSSQDVR